MTMGIVFNNFHSSALGNGYRCGFLGVLHLEVFTQRLEQEFGIAALNTAPSVPYKCKPFLFNIFCCF